MKIHSLIRTKDLMVSSLTRITPFHHVPWKLVYIFFPILLPKEKQSNQQTNWQGWKHEGETILALVMIWHELRNNHASLNYLSLNVVCNFLRVESSFGLLWLRRESGSPTNQKVSGLIPVSPPLASQSVLGQDTEHQIALHSCAGRVWVMCDGESAAHIDALHGCVCVNGRSALWSALSCLQG